MIRLAQLSGSKYLTSYKRGHSITTENTTLKQRLQQLTNDNRLDERLQASRSNLRFQDRRIADLETQLAPPEHVVDASRRPSTPTERHAESR